MPDPLSEFIAACARGEAIILGKAEISARSEFNLLTKSEIQTFIGGENLELIKFRDKRAFDKNPAFTVYAYNFHSGKKYGYMAIFCNSEQKWCLKSFKKNWDKDPRGTPFSVPMISMARIGELK